MEKSDTAQLCPNRTNCKMFKIFKNHDTGQALRRLYCDSIRYTSCARYIRMRDGEQVSDNLLPNGNTLD